MATILILVLAVLAVGWLLWKLDLLKVAAIQAVVEICGELLLSVLMNWS